MAVTGSFGTPEKEKTDLPVQTDWAEIKALTVSMQMTGFIREGVICVGAEDKDLTDYLHDWLMVDNRQSSFNSYRIDAIPYVSDLGED